MQTKKFESYLNYIFFLKWQQSNNVYKKVPQLILIIVLTFTHIHYNCNTPLHNVFWLTSIISLFKILFKNSKISWSIKNIKILKSFKCTIHVFKESLCISPSQRAYFQGMIIGTRSLPTRHRKQHFKGLAPFF